MQKKRHSESVRDREKQKDNDRYGDRHSDMQREITTDRLTN